MGPVHQGVPAGRVLLVLVPALGRQQQEAPVLLQDGLALAVQEALVTPRRSRQPSNRSCAPSRSSELAANRYHLTMTPSGVVRASRRKP